MARPYCHRQVRRLQQRAQPRRHLVHLRKRKRTTYLISQRHMQARNAQAIQQNRLLEGIKVNTLAVRIEEHRRRYVDRIQTVNARNIVVLLKDTVKRHCLVKRHRVTGSHVRTERDCAQSNRTRSHVLCQRMLRRPQGVDERILKHTYVSIKKLTCIIYRPSLLTLQYHIRRWGNRRTQTTTVRVHAPAEPSRSVALL